MLVNFLLLILGVALIVVGGNWFVDAASWVAEKLHIPKFIIGATIVSVATTMPEMIVSIMATCKGANDMAAGNAIGSVVANIGLILALSLAVRPTTTERKSIGLKSMLLIAIVLVLVIFGTGTYFTSQSHPKQGVIGIVPTVLCFIGFALFLWENASSARSSMLTAPKEQNEEGQTAAVDGAGVLIINILKFVVGAAMLYFGSRLLVDNGSAIALKLGVPEGIIAVTLVAVGTSLPELVTTITSLVKKQGSLGVGNIIGANIMDVALIMPICSIISMGKIGEPLIISAQTCVLDLPVTLLFSLIALVPALIDGKFRRWQGVGLLALYAAYIAGLLVFFA